MTTSKIRIALAQQRISADKDVNLMKGLSLVKRALQVRANLVILPELFTTGFYENNLRAVKDLNEELDLLIRLSMEKDIVIIAGVAEKSEKLYNSAVVIHRGEITGVYRKNLLFPLTKEKEIFAEGKGFEIFETPVGKIGILICYELRFPELARKLVKKGAELIAIPAEFPKQRIEHWKTLLRARAIENQVFVAGVNCVEGDLGYGGCSMLVDPEGKVLVEGGIYQEVLMSDIDLGDVYAVREKYPFLKDYESLDTQA